MPPKARRASKKDAKAKSKATPAVAEEPRGEAGQGQGQNVEEVEMAELEPVKVEKVTPITVRVFAGNLPDDVQSADLRQIFSPYGNILGLELIKNDRGRRPFAFVTFGSAREANVAAVLVNQRVYKERPMSVHVVDEIRKTLHPTSGLPNNFGRRACVNNGGQRSQPEGGAGARDRSRSPRGRNYRELSPD